MGITKRNIEHSGAYHFLQTCNGIYVLADLSIHISFQLWYTHLAAYQVRKIPDICEQDIGFTSCHRTLDLGQNSCSTDVLCLGLVAVGQTV